MRRAILAFVIMAWFIISITVLLGEPYEEMTIWRLIIAKTLSLISLLACLAVRKELTKKGYL